MAIKELLIHIPFDPPQFSSDCTFKFDVIHTVHTVVDACKCIIQSVGSLFRASCSELSVTFLEHTIFLKSYVSTYQTMMFVFFYFFVFSHFYPQAAFPLLSFADQKICFFLFDALCLKGQYHEIFGLLFFPSN